MVQVWNKYQWVQDKFENFLWTQSGFGYDVVPSQIICNIKKNDFNLFLTFLTYINFIFFIKINYKYL